MLLVLYTLYSVLNKKLISPFDFQEWLFCSPKHKKFWICFFSVLMGFFIAIAARDGELIILYPALLCFITILVFDVNMPPVIKKVIRTIENPQIVEVDKIITIEKIIEKEKTVLIPPGGNCGVIYILRRSDGIFKFGKAKHLRTRLAQHRNDYQTNFDAVSSWVVPNMDTFEALALSLTGQYAYQEDNRRELRKMSDSELSQFVLEFTNKVQKGWMQ